MTAEEFLAWRRRMYDQGYSKTEVALCILGLKSVRAMDNWTRDRHRIPIPGPIERVCWYVDAWGLRPDDEVRVKMMRSLQKVDSR